MAILTGLKRSLTESYGTIVFGMEDGTVSIFGLIFGVAVTTSNTKAILIAGATGAAAAAVSMMAGAYLDAETDRDSSEATRAQLSQALEVDPAARVALLTARLEGARLPPVQLAALTGAVCPVSDAFAGLITALQVPNEAKLNPFEQAGWMLLADFLSASVPIVPFIVLPVAAARIVSAAMTLALLVFLGIGRARIGNRGMVKTVLETVSIGVAAALAGVGIGTLIDGCFGG